MVGEVVAVTEVLDGVAALVAAAAAGFGAETGPLAALGPDLEAVGAAVAQGAGAGVFAAVDGRGAAEGGIAGNEGEEVGVVGDHGWEGPWVRVRGMDLAVLSQTRVA